MHSIRINHQRPSRAAHSDDSILSAEIISWETLNIPLTHVSRTSTEPSKSKVIREGELFFLDSCKPAINLQNGSSIQKQLPAK